MVLFIWFHDGDMLIEFTGCTGSGKSIGGD